MPENHGAVPAATEPPWLRHLLLLQWVLPGLTRAERQELLVDAAQQAELTAKSSLRRSMRNENPGQVKKQIGLRITNLPICQQAWILKLATKTAPNSVQVARDGGQGLNSSADSAPWLTGPVFVSALISCAVIGPGGKFRAPIYLFGAILGILSQLDRDEALRWIQFFGYSIRKEGQGETKGPDPEAESFRLRTSELLQYVASTVGVKIIDGVRGNPARLANQVKLEGEDLYSFWSQFDRWITPWDPGSVDHRDRNKLDAERTAIPNAKKDRWLYHFILCHQCLEDTSDRARLKLGVYMPRTSDNDKKNLNRHGDEDDAAAEARDIEKALVERKRLRESAIGRVRVVLDGGVATDYQPGDPLPEARWVDVFRGTVKLFSHEFTPKYMFEDAEPVVTEYEIGKELFVFSETPDGCRLRFQPVPQAAADQVAKGWAERWRLALGAMALASLVFAAFVLRQAAQKDLVESVALELAPPGTTLGSGPKEQRLIVRLRRGSPGKPPFSTATILGAQPENNIPCRIEPSEDGSQLILPCEGILGLEPGTYRLQLSGPDPGRTVTVPFKR